MLVLVRPWFPAGLTLPISFPQNKKPSPGLGAGAGWGWRWHSTHGWHHGSSPGWNPACRGSPDARGTPRADVSMGQFYACRAHTVRVGVGSAEVSELPSWHLVGVWLCMAALASAVVRQLRCLTLLKGYRQAHSQLLAYANLTHMLRGQSYPSVPRKVPKTSRLIKCQRDT